MYIPSNILVTGGAGFIGSHLIKELYSPSTEYNVINVDLLTYAGNKKNLTELPITNIYYVDINDNVIGGILKDYNIDTVINFAAQTHVDRSIKYPREFVETEIVGLFNLIYWSMKRNVKRFVHISTDEVYGDEYEGEAYEFYILNPNSPYAASKAAADILILSYVKTYNFPAIIVRPCNNYGPNQYPEKLIPVAITRLLSGKKVPIHGTGGESREWIYVEDCCKAIHKLTIFGHTGEIYNIGSGYRMRNIDTVVNILKLMHGPTINISEYIEFIKNRPGNDTKYAINSDKCKSIIGDYNTTYFGSGLNETITWYYRNKDSWGSIDIESNFHDDENYLR